MVMMGFCHIDKYKNGNAYFRFCMLSDTGQVHLLSEGAVLG